MYERTPIDDFYGVNSDTRGLQWLEKGTFYFFYKLFIYLFLLTNLQRDKILSEVLYNNFFQFI